MQFDQDENGVLTPLPNQNIDTGMGLNRMALIHQDVETIFETDQFVPLIDLGKELATGEVDDRALRILADHTRAMTFLIADGVVPSNEDRGFILRRVMRRAIQQGHRIGIEPGFLPQYVDQVVELMGGAYPELVSERNTILKWAKAEEEGFGRTLEAGLKILEEHLHAGSLDAAAAFQLHDTYGFPISLTQEIAAERGLDVDEAGFTVLMDEQRARSAGGAGSKGRVGGAADVVRSLSTHADRVHRLRAPRGAHVDRSGRRAGRNDVREARLVAVLRRGWRAGLRQRIDRLRGRGLRGGRLGRRARRG